MTSTSIQNNLLVALRKYAKQQGENFTTEVFAHLLRHLQAYDYRLASHVIRVLTQEKLVLGPEECGNFAVTTQDTHEQGITDMIIRGSEVFVVVEVKVESNPGWDQLDRYNDLLAKRPEKFKLLVLLSRYPVDVNEVEKAGAHVRWDQIARALKQGSSSLVNPVSTFLVKEFLDFLRREGMAVDKVSWELVRGIESLMSLMGKIDEATAASKDVKKREKLGGTGTNGYGFVLGTRKCWVGIYYSKPQIVVFETYNVPKVAAEQLGVGRAEPEGKGVFKWINELDLGSEDVHFFALSPDNQQRRIEGFISEGVSVVKRLPVA